MTSGGAVKNQSNTKLPVPEQFVISVVPGVPLKLSPPTNFAKQGALETSSEPLAFTLLNGQLASGIQLMEEPPGKTIMVLVSVNGTQGPEPSGSFEVKVKVTVPM